MSEPQYDNLFVNNAIVDEGGIRTRGKPAHAGTACNVSRVWMDFEQRHHCEDTLLNPHCPLRRSLGDIIECLVNLLSCAVGIAQLHFLCLAQMARICSSEAKSPRATSSSAAAKSASSSGVSSITGNSAYIKIMRAFHPASRGQEPERSQPPDREALSYVPSLAELGNKYYHVPRVSSTSSGVSSTRPS
jgi:hypothetical protein